MIGSEFWPPVLLSVRTSLLASILVFFVGIALARVLARKHFHGKMLVETLLMLPLVLPPSVVGFLLLIALGRRSLLGQGIEWMFHGPLIFTWWAVVAAEALVAFPLMFQSAKTGFSIVNTEVEEAAQLDGAGVMTLFVRITLPLAARSIVSGLVLSYARALGEFGATLMIAGSIPGKTQTIPTAIYVAVDSGNLREAWLWVLIMILLSFLMLIAVYRK